MGVKEPEGLTLACKLPFHKMTSMTQAKCTFLTCTLYLYNKNLHNTDNNTGTQHKGHWNRKNYSTKYVRL